MMSTQTTLAMARFQTTLSKTTILHGELVALSQDGWCEELPSEDWWHFTHPDFPGIIINWSPRHTPWVD